SDKMEEFAEIEFNYGGKMVEGGEHVEYKGGLQKVMTVGLASVTHFELSCTAAVDLQYERIEKMWYLDNGLHRVSSDSDLKNCLDTAPGCPKKIFIYLEGVSRPGAIHHEAVRGVSHLVDNDDRTSDEEFNAAMGFLGVRCRRRRVGTRDDMSGEEVEQLSVFESDVVISSSSNEGDQPNDEARTNAREGPRSPPPEEYESNHLSYRGSEESDHVRGNLSDEDGEGNYSRGPLYDPGCDHGALQFELGLRFRDPTQFKEAVIRNSIIVGANVRRMRSSKTRREVVCKHPSCKWRLYAAWYRGRELFVVKQIGAAHSCPRKSRNTQATAKWIANDLLERFRINPNIEIAHILAEMKLKYGLELEPRQCYRAKVEARKLLTGTLEAEYMKIRSYIAELRRADPGGRFIVEVDTADSLDFVYFKRIFVCFSSLKEGFLRGCRPMFGLDVCFLKGEVSGMILSAVGKDGNNQMYPISWAVVEGENKNSWAWFLRTLQEELALSDGNGCCGYWGISGIPCHHGMSAITCFRLDVEPFVHKYYYTDYVVRGYTNGIPPLLGQQAWPQVSGCTIHPPRMKRMPGRPKKARRNEASELHPSSSQRGGRTRLVDTEMVMHCRNCNEPGHNSRSCTYVPTEPPTEHVQRTTSTEALQERVQVREEPPVVGTGRGGPRKCRTCKKHGHNSRSCPTKRGIQVVELNDSRRSVVQRELNTIAGVGVYTNPTTGNTYYRVRTGVH
ncbi:hypothetical protein LINPERHAP2_LOCUS15933, partial [Linum perenne]